MSPKRQRERRAPTVTHDGDGGVTIHDIDTGIVVSIISSSPYANGPRSLIIEPYAWASDKQVAMTKVILRGKPIITLDIVDREIVPVTAEPGSLADRLTSAL